MNKKQFIMDKSLELFAEKGFNATSIQQITSHCGISKGAFYLSFKSKDELIISLIEHFLQEVITGIDQVVRDSDIDELPFNFYYYHFKNLSKRSHFAKIFIKEHTHFSDNGFIVKIHEYNELMQQSTLFMLEKAYGEKIKQSKFDMVYSVQGLIKAYAELFLFDGIQLDIKQLCKSLTEKTNILANYAKTPFITNNLHQLINCPQEKSFTKDHLIEIIDETIQSLDASIEKESLQLLKEELIHPSMKQAVIQGLLSNVRNHPDCKWAAYAFQSYFSK